LNDLLGRLGRAETQFIFPNKLGVLEMSNLPRH
jgi:hypothetical protein